MTFCECCSTSVLRRRRIQGKLVCHECGQLLNDPFWLLTRYNELKQSITPEKKPNLIPPRHILESACLSVDLTGEYHDFPIILAHYYKIDVPPYYHDPKKVPQNAVACYYPSTNTVYSKGPMGFQTAFHEFYHALEKNGIIHAKDSEVAANLYAKTCLKILEKET